MMQIDGARGSGSGTIVRFATALAVLLRCPLRITNARARRPKPGLRPQHLAAVRACAELSGAEIDGLTVGSQELTIRPGAGVRGGRFDWDIGTAGSTTMLALGILPLACFADRPVVARIAGGVFQDFAPSPFHIQHVLAALVARMGAQAELRLVRPGYVPTGGGVIELRVQPARRGLRALALPAPGAVRAVRGIALASHLAERQVSERMAAACEARVGAAGLACAIERLDDTSASHAGAGLAVWAHTATGCVLGADRAGALRRRAEVIGREVADQLLADLAAGASVDRHAADQLVLFAALAAGRSRYVAPAVTDHLDTNLWLAEQFGARVCRRGPLVELEGVALRP